MSLDNNNVDSFGSRGKTEVFTTQLTATTSEVAAAIEDFRTGGAILAYEFLQNAFDYNDYTKGLPEVNFSTKMGRTLTLQEIFALQSEEELKAVAATINKIQVFNFLSETQLFTPDSLFGLSHGGGAGKLGEHGRGGRISLTALLAMNMASKVELSSRNEEGNWAANCTYGATEDSAIMKKEYLQLAFPPPKQQENNEKTELTIVDPKPEMIVAFWRLKHKFLPVIAAYQHQLLVSSKETVDEEQNLFTLKAARQAGHEDFGHSFVEEFDNTILTRLQFDSDLLEKYQHTPRVEIIPRKVLGDSQGEVVNGKQKGTAIPVFVDGLQVNYENYLASRAIFDWSFWGLRNGEYGYGAQRSSDSKKLNGGPEKMMATVLGSCTNPEVFHRLFVGLTDEKGGTVWEGTLDQQIIYEQLQQSSQAREALREGWRLYLEDKGFTPPCIVTTNPNVQKELESKGIPAVVMHYERYVEILVTLGFAKRPEEKVERLVNARDFTLDLTASAVEQQPFLDYLYDWLLDNLGSLRVPQNGEEVIIHLPSVANVNPHNREIQKYDQIPETLQRLMKQLLADPWGKTVLVLTTPGLNGMGQEITIAPPATETYFHPQRYMLSYGCEIKSVPSQSQEWTLHLVHIPGGSVSDGAQTRIQRLIEELKESKVLSGEGQVDVEQFLQAFPDTAKRSAQANLQKARLDMLRMTQALEAIKQLNGEVKRSSPHGDVLYPALDLSKLNELEIPQRVLIGLFVPGQAVTPAEYAPSAYKEVYDKDKATRILESVLAAFEYPDMQLQRPEGLPAAARVISLGPVNSLYGMHPQEWENITTTVEGKPSADAAPALVINRKIPPGLWTIPIPFGTRIVSIDHPMREEFEGVTVKRSAGKYADGTVTLETSHVISPGTTIIVEGAQNLQQSFDESERDSFVKVEALNSGVTTLVEKLKTTIRSGDTKKAVDIAITWWSQVFEWKPDYEVGKQFNGTYFADLLNTRKGGAAQASGGFIGLMRLVGIPARERLAYRAVGGRAFAGPSTYPLVDVFFNNTWHLIDPRTGYIDTDKDRKVQVDSNSEELIAKFWPGGSKYDKPTENPYERLGLDEVIRTSKTILSEGGQKAAVFKVGLRRLREVLEADAAFDAPFYAAFLDANDMRTPRGRKNIQGVVTGAGKVIATINEVFEDEDKALALPYDAEKIMRETYIPKHRWWKDLVQDIDWQWLAKKALKGVAITAAGAALLFGCSLVAPKVFPELPSSPITVPDWLANIIPQDLLHQDPGDGGNGDGKGEGGAGGNGEGVPHLGPDQDSEQQNGLPRNPPDWFLQCVEQAAKENDLNLQGTEIWQCLKAEIEAPTTPSVIPTKPMGRS